MRMKDRRAFEKKDKDLLDFARAYLSEAFPNPDREGCPSETALRSLAFNPRESELTVTEHLAVCSPCFRRYGELLAELKSQREADKGFSWGRISAWTKTHPVLAGTAALCVLFIAIGVGLLFRRTSVPNAPPVETHRTPTPVEPVNPTSDLALGEPGRVLRSKTDFERPDIMVEVCPSSSAKRQNANSGRGGFQANPNW